MKILNKITNVIELAILIGYVFIGIGYTYIIERKRR